MPGLYRKLVRSKSKWDSLFDGTKERNGLEAAPLLILACANGKLQVRPSLFRWIGENGTYTSSVLMLGSPLAMESVRSRLAARLEVKLSGNMEAMLRFFDPRIFEKLALILAPEQASTFFSVAEKWWYVDRAGDLRCIKAQLNPKEERYRPLELSERQEFDLVDGSEPDQVLALLREYVPNLMLKLPISRQHHVVAECIEEAKEIGLNAPLDFFLFVTMVLAKGEKLIQEPIWLHLMNSVRVKAMSFAEALMKIEIDEI
jgi:hypothetical protein